MHTETPRTTLHVFCAGSEKGNKGKGEIKEMAKQQLNELSSYRKGEKGKLTSN